MEQKHNWKKAFSIGRYVCENCGCMKDETFEPVKFNHPDTGIVTVEPPCPPIPPNIPALYNGQTEQIEQLKAGNLSGKYTGLVEWKTLINVPTMSVYHEWHKYGPVATFHSALAINLKEGVIWYPADLQALLELHAQWCELIGQTKANNNDKDQRITN